MAMLYIIFAFYIAFADATSKSYRVNVYTHGEQKKEDILFDAAKQYAIVTFDASGDKNGFRSSVNLLDFKLGYSAIKDVSLGKCYVTHNTHTMKEVMSSLNKLLKGNKHTELKLVKMSCKQTRIPHKILGLLVGNRIANFCENYETVFVKSELVKHSLSERAMAGAKLSRILRLAENLLEDESITANKAPQYIRRQ